MAAIFKIADGVPCRACGAVLAPAHDNAFGLCAHCWTQACLFVGAEEDLRRHGGGRGQPTDEDVTAWLGSKLVKDLKRLERTGLSSRCEAISGWAYGRPGTQCAKVATDTRDGHFVCYRHANATAPVYVGDEQSDPYIVLRDLMARLRVKDERFAAIIREVAA